MSNVSAGWRIASVGIAIALFAAVATPRSAEAQGTCHSLCDNTCIFGLEIRTNGEPYNNINAPDFICRWGGCLGGCGQTDDREEDMIETAQSAAERGDIVALASIINGDDGVVLNMERRAVQIMSKCTAGHVAVNIALDVQQMAVIRPLVRNATVLTGVIDDWVVVDDLANLRSLPLIERR